MYMRVCLYRLKRTQGRALRIQLDMRALKRRLTTRVSIDISRISVTYVLYLRRGARSLCRPYISDERTGYCATARLSYPSSLHPFPGCSSSFYSRDSLVSLSVPLLSARRWRWHYRGKKGVDGGSLEVSLTILRNFADSLARVDHVRPVLRSHGSGREGENGFSRGSEGSEGGKRGGRERRAGPD